MFKKSPLRGNVFLVWGTFAELDESSVVTFGGALHPDAAIAHATSTRIEPREALGNHRLALSLLCVGVLAASRLRSLQLRCNGCCYQSSCRSTCHSGSKLPQTQQESACDFPRENPAGSAADLLQESNACPLRSPSEFATPHEFDHSAETGQVELVSPADAAEPNAPRAIHEFAANLPQRPSAPGASCCNHDSQTNVQMNRQTLNDEPCSMPEAAHAMTPIGLPSLPAKNLTPTANQRTMMTRSHKQNKVRDEPTSMQALPCGYPGTMEATVILNQQQQPQQQLARSGALSRSTSAQCAEHHQIHLSASDSVAPVAVLSNAGVQCNIGPCSSRKNCSNSHSSSSSQSPFTRSRRLSSRSRVRFAACGTPDSSDCGKAASRDDNFGGRQHLKCRTASTDAVNLQSQVAEPVQLQQCSTGTAADISSASGGRVAQPGAPSTSIIKMLPVQPRCARKGSRHSSCVCAPSRMYCLYHSSLG